MNVPPFLSFTKNILLRILSLVEIVVISLSPTLRIAQDCSYLANRSFAVGKRKGLLWLGSLRWSPSPIGQSPWRGGAKILWLQHGLRKLKNRLTPTQPSLGRGTLLAQTQNQVNANLARGEEPSPGETKTRYSSFSLSLLLREKSQGPVKQDTPPSLSLLFLSTFKK